MGNLKGDRSPLAPPRLETPGPIAGVEVAGAHIGLKRGRGAKDLMVARLAPETTVAGVLTQSRCPSAAVEWCRHILPRGQARALIVNSGNANAFTGEGGRDVVRQTTAAAARLFRCRRDRIYIASTGVIGEPVPPGHIAKALPRVAARVRADGWKAAAEAITTTDTFPKAAVRTARIGDKTVTVGGIAKGSGMIAPDMATMLAFLFTDAKLAGPLLQRLLKGAVRSSFNAITVDGDTSTSDTTLLFATGRGPRHPSVETVTDPLLRDFRRALGEVSADLAQQVVRDGEGASKFVTINVTGAESKRAARRIGLTIGNSPLVKTAIAGADANWGRIVMAVGKAGEKADRDRLAIAIGGVPITEGGRVRPGYDEGPVAAHMQQAEIVIDVDVGVGRGRATIWTCDLTHGYIRINADYRS
ncbi:MAG: bifunctional glutamate N-acetyltransferase/amino-acid acetyltransferase ArgJ [Alphaproteobacteria bacterium]